MKMKKKFFLPVFFCVFIFVIIYLFRTYNPNSPSLKTSIVTYLAKLTDIFYSPYYFKSYSLPVYELTLNPDNYVFLNRNLPDAIQTKILTAEYKRYVPAKFKYQEQEYDVDVHYYGTDFDHWARPKKSWQIKFNDNQPFFGQTIINLVIPEDRGMYLQELSNFRAKKLGLFIPSSKFTVLKVNGKTQGVYWQFEHWTAAFLEKNQLPIGNLYGEVDQSVKRSEQKPIYSSLKYWKKYVQDEIYQNDNYAELALLLDLLNHAEDEEFFSQLPYILDIDSFLAWQAHLILMGSSHQDSTHNIRLYWHPALGKFFIFPWDVLGSYGWPVSYNPLVSRVLKNPEWLKQRNQILSDYVNNVDNLREDLGYYDQLIEQTKTAVFQDYLKFFSNYGYVQQTKKYRQQIIDQLQLIKDKLDQQNIPNETSGFDLPFSQPINVTDPSKTIIDSEFKDFDKLFQSPQKLIYSGVNYINETIIIPSGYQVKLLSGVKLVFAENVSFISYSPIQANNVILTAQDSSKPWGVFAVIGQQASGSSFDHLIAEHAGEAIVNGTYFTGALAIHNVSGAIITNSIFRFNHGDDGLNIKYADAQVSNNQFINNDYDGFDLDFGDGEIKNNIFTNNGNDGLDLGSASPLIENNLIDNSGDKCISLGETSGPQISNNILKNCNIGIAVKDSSQPEISNNQIINNHIGLASYQKKPIFSRLPFIFKNNHLQNNEIDFEEEDASLRKENL